MFITAVCFMFNQATMAQEQKSFCWVFYNNMLQTQIQSKVIQFASKCELKRRQILATSTRTPNRPKKHVNNNSSKRVVDSE